MGILQQFERHLEGAVEGAFARAFRSGVQPVELGKRLLRAAEDGRTVGVRQVYVPNVFVYELSAPDQQRFAAYERALEAELAQLLIERARDRGWALLGPVRITFVVDAELIEGRFRVSGHVEASEQPIASDPPLVVREVAPAQSTSLLGQTPAAQFGGGGARPAPVASLVLLSPDGPQVFKLHASSALLGRGEDADVPLADPAVSRAHARLLREDDDWVIEDLDSTNGTEVNGKPISRRRLVPGDRIRLGTSVLELRREQ